MIQAIKDTIQCSRCGCIALPDATKCPKCGVAYNGNGAKELIDSIAYISNPIMEDTSIQLIRAYYQLICPRHGKVYVKATAIGPTIKCPFCP